MKCTVTSVINEVRRYFCQSKQQNENEGNEWQLGSVALKTKLEEFVRNQKDALSAEVKNIHAMRRLVVTFRNLLMSLQGISNLLLMILSRK